MILAREVETFLAVAQYHSLTVASEHLFVTVAAISQQMKKLEHETGVQLLNRNKKGVTLTPAGEVFLEKIEQIKRLEEEALLLARWADRRTFPDTSTDKTEQASDL